MEFTARLIFKDIIITIMGISIFIGGIGLAFLGVYLTMLSTIGIPIK